MNNSTDPRPGMLPDKPTLSVCMIVRDEEEMLARCLKSVQGVADELIVVDTGSKDDTVIIAKDFGARVFHFEWCDDFAAARNESLKHATGDWILQIDADEELLSESILHLKECIRNSDVLSYLIKRDEGPDFPVRRFLALSRLFRNHPGIRYERPYHEGIERSVEDLITVETRWQKRYEPGIVIRHHGYKPSKMHSKMERGLPIMESYLKRNPYDAYMLTALGDAYSVLGRYAKAEEYLKQTLEIAPDWSLTSFCLGLTLQKQGKLKSAIQSHKKAIVDDANCVDAYACLGAIYMDMGMLHEALSALRRGLAISPELDSLQGLLAKAEAMLENSITELKSSLSSDSERASVHNDLGLSYLSKDMYDAGIEQFKKAIAVNPALAVAHMNLGVAYAKKGMLHDALVEFKQALTIDPGYGEAHYNMALTFYKKGEYTQSIWHCDRAAELGFEIHPQFLEWLEPYRPQ
jgi:tetratricopeptide (TPR) repeat protein